MGLGSRRNREMCILDINLSANQSSPMPRTNIEIGRDYERYVGYRYEMEGWQVIYRGILRGKADQGRDLVCHREDSVHIVQCKCWSSSVEIDCEVVEKLYQTTKVYRQVAQPFGQLDLAFGIHARRRISPVLITSTGISQDAHELAAQRGVLIKPSFQLQPYHKVKCVLRTRNYYLEQDYLYDSIEMRVGDGDRYVASETDARELGFQHAGESIALFAARRSTVLPTSIRNAIADKHSLTTGRQDMGEDRSGCLTLLTNFARLLGLRRLRLTPELGTWQPVSADEAAEDMRQMLLG